MSENKNQESNQDPLHGITLKMIVTQLVEYYGWKALAENININCFKSNPSIKSSLKFLRRTEWARVKIEALYVTTFAKASPWRKSHWPVGTEQ